MGYFGFNIDLTEYRYNFLPEILYITIKKLQYPLLQKRTFGKVLFYKLHNRSGADNE